MAQLLVSVRSAGEARAALTGGASIIDVKEPDQGSLGRAPWSVWQDVSRAVGGSATVSVALGELPEWTGADCPVPPANAWAGIAYCKLGLAGSGRSWRLDWQAVRSRLDQESGPLWIAVIYVDWRAAHAPDPEEVLEATLSSASIAGVLIDTWDKTQPAELDPAWAPLFRQIRQAGRLLALAGGLDLLSIPSLSRYSPDIVAVRGAACVDGNRRLGIDVCRVSTLAHAVGRLP